mmetsp:Transcript_7228/g.18822  ORF Transcript_7228/g.18822 Transcript_7228/m.18822 type:complete len:343 (-) Transcript_7228:58-1086(-)
MVRIFSFFFCAMVMNQIITSTMSKAREVVVRGQTDEGKWRLRPPRDDDPPSLVQRPRYQMLVDLPLSEPELRVFIGIWIIMGKFPREHIRDYWDTTVAGFRLDLIADHMTRGRFEVILSALSFLKVGSIALPGDQLRKYRLVDDLIPFVAIGNTYVSFMGLYPGAAAEEDHYTKNRFGHKRHYQIGLGEALIRLGVNTLNDLVGSPATRLRTTRLRTKTRAPQLPQALGRKRTLFMNVSIPANHEHVNAAQVVTQNDAISHRPSAYMPKQGTCRGCAAQATLGKRHAAVHAQTAPTLPNGKPLLRISISCSKCQAHLCELCFYDPLAWDHQAKRAPPKSVIA